MAGSKRKENPNSTLHSGNSSKKPKKEERPAKRVQDLETATDSDPLVESDTTTQSDDDDGASWPSDEESKEGEFWEGVGVAEENEDRGVKTAAVAAGASQPASKAASTNANSSKDSHAKQKVEKQERKAAKPNADSIARSKKLWERLRRKSHVPKEERKVLVAELFDIITGRVKDFVFKHDSVRVIQTALKYANVDQRKMIAGELKGEYKTLAESKYAKFLIGKMLVHGDEETRDLVVPEFYGHVRRMIKHSEASWIMDDIYRGIATPSQKATLLREWYGAEFALFKSSEAGSVSADLKQILEDHPEKRTPIMRSLHDLVNLLVQKKTTGFTMLHDAMLQQFLNLTPGSEEATEFIELLKGDEEVLLAVYDVIDDTVLVSKSAFPEIVGKEPLSDSQQQDLLQTATHLNARVTLLYPFCGKVKAILSNEDLKLLDEIHSIRSTTSKKDPEVRRKELVASLSPPLLSIIAQNAKELVPMRFGCQLISEVLLGAPEGREPAVIAITALAEGDDETKSLLESPAAGRMLKSLVLGGRFNPTKKGIDLADPPLRFHDIFYSAIKDDILSWATGANSFVVVGLLEAPGFSHVEELKEKLSKGKRRLKLAEAAGLAEDGGGKVKGKNAKGAKSEEVAPVKGGNKGTKLLLMKLDGK